MMRKNRSVFGRSLGRPSVSPALLGILALAVGLLAAPFGALATLSGTNAVTLMSANVENASETAWPIVLGCILVLGTLGVFLKFGRRAGFRS